METSPNEGPRPAPAGTLQKLASSHRFDLSHVDLHALMIEVWKRLESGESLLGSGAMVSLGDAIAERLAASLDVHQNRFSARRFSDLFDAFHRHLKAPRPRIEGATFVDVGCGAVNPLGMCMLMCALGARSAIAVDLDAVQDWPRALRGIARLADLLVLDHERVVGPYPITREQIIRNLEGVDVHALRRGNPAGLGSRLRHVRESAANLPLADGSVDIVVSNSFLEHVPDVAVVLREIARVTAKDGFGIHGIDGTDHLRYTDRSVHLLQFLREPGRGMSGSSNRIRPLEYAALFAEHGFFVQETRTLIQAELSREEIAGFAEPWRSLPPEVLQVACATLVTRRR